MSWAGLGALGHVPIFPAVSFEPRKTDQTRDHSGVLYPRYCWSDRGAEHPL